MTAARLQEAAPRREDSHSVGLERGELGAPVVADPGGALLRPDRIHPTESLASPAPAAVSGLVTRFGPHLIHDHIDLAARPGEVLGIVGGSGTGKSVLLRTMLGLIRPAAGHVTLFGHNIHRLSRRQRRAVLERIGVLFQDGALFSSLTVAENIMLPMREHTRLDRRHMQALAALKIALVGLPSDAGEKLPAQLSGGMRKRAGLARALALEPELLFLDEPTAGLDPPSATGFDRLVRDLQTSLGLTVVMVTHDLDSIAAICDRIAVLVDRQVRVGTLETLLEETHPWIRSYFHGPRAHNLGETRACDPSDASSGMSQGMSC